MSGPVSLERQRDSAAGRTAVRVAAVSYSEAILRITRNPGPSRWRRGQVHPRCPSQRCLDIDATIVVVVERDIYATVVVAEVVEVVHLRAVGASPQSLQ